MEFIRYEVTDDKVAIITLDRPEKANAQHRPFLVELNQCWTDAARDDDVNVILLRANGRHFSAGHDLTGGTPQGNGELAPEMKEMQERARARGQVYATYLGESEYFFGYSMAWRNVTKPSIAAVQGKCVAAGMMLCWPCDLIIAADNAEFSDPTARMGLAGVEYMAHAWEFGPRKAKELLFRSRAITAEEARELGMVNKVVPLDELQDEAMGWARDVATLDPMMTHIIKRGINQTQDIQGFQTALAHSFDLHEFAHAMQGSHRAANPDAPRPNILDHMRQTNKELAGDTAEERAAR
jgi:enoyl-CoA hydratase